MLRTGRVRLRRKRTKEKANNLVDGTKPAGSASLGFGSVKWGGTGLLQGLHEAEGAGAPNTGAWRSSPCPCLEVASGGLILRSPVTCYNWTGCCPSPQTLRAGATHPTEEGTPQGLGVGWQPLDSACPIPRGSHLHIHAGGSEEPRCSGTGPNLVGVGQGSSQELDEAVGAWGAPPGRQVH